MNLLPMAVTCVVVSAAMGQDEPVPIGIETRYIYRTEHALRAKPVVSRQNVLVRIAEQKQDGAATLYDLRAMPMVKGSHDLRSALERVDGGPMDALPPVVLEAASIVPKAHRGIDPRPDPAPPRLGGYQLAMIGAGALWLAPVLWFGGRALLRRRKAPAPVALAAPPTLADQLRPLVEAAIAGRASVDERARLERLLLAHWRERLSLAELSPHEALVKLKEHADAGVILRAVERWLHMPRGDGDGAPDIAALLAPYRGAAVVVPNQEVEFKPLKANAARGEDSR